MSRQRIGGDDEGNVVVTLVEAAGTGVAGVGVADEAQHARDVDGDDISGGHDEHQRGIHAQRVMRATHGRGQRRARTDACTSAVTQEVGLSTQAGDVP